MELSKGYPADVCCRCETCCWLEEIPACFGDKKSQKCGLLSEKVGNEHFISLSTMLLLQGSRGSPSFYSTALWAGGSSTSRNGHTYSSDLTLVPSPLLRAHLSLPRISVCTEPHYGEDGFDES